MRQVQAMTCPKFTNDFFGDRQLEIIAFCELTRSQSQVRHFKGLAHLNPP
ncbi:hypothetical protein Riv7116_3448 [Rivularia sp. PCC 7116]|nr:hypothetical protein [Rivularia sp. PCC 7116]AFY55903.1 hypothetical protein Riv7116_3448 [Rivularia sp. PCC 7116]